MANNNNSNAGWVIGGIMAVLLIIGALMIFSQPSQSNSIDQSSSGRLATDENSYDFGSVSMAKGKVSKVFTIKNPSADPITVSKVYTSCMCTSALYIKGDRRMGPFGMPGHASIPVINQTINSGEEAQIEVIFDPAAHGPSGVGYIVREISIETQKNGKLSLQIQATVTP